MKIEREVTILDIDKEKFVELILKLGAEKVSDELTQIRYTYDFVPAQANKWIRLRTNGQKSTLTIKEVSDFEETNKILNELGYFYRNKQENKRQVFMLDGVEISVDTWPKIPPYAEFEGQTEKDVKNLLKKLNIPPEKITTLDVSSIYKEIYGIDILKIKDLTF
jgi:adenylate cyclase class 2